MLYSIRTFSHPNKFETKKCTEVDKCKLYFTTKEVLIMLFQKRFVPYRISSIILILLLVLCSTISINAHAAEIDTVTINYYSARTVYYPVSGSTSGTFTGTSSPTYTYSYLPAGEITISYSYISTSTSDTIRFYKDGNLVTYKTLSTYNGNLATTTVKLSEAGTYTVRIVSNHNGSEKIYAFDLHN